MPRKKSTTRKKKRTTRKKTTTRRTTVNKTKPLPKIYRVEAKVTMKSKRLTKPEAEVMKKQAKKEAKNAVVTVKRV